MFNVNNHQKDLKQENFNYQVDKMKEPVDVSLSLQFFVKKKKKNIKMVAREIEVEAGYA